MFESEVTMADVPAAVAMTGTRSDKDFVAAMNGAVVLAFPTGAQICLQSTGSGTSDEFRRFSDLAGKLLGVPKEEVDALPRDHGQEMTAEIESDPDRAARLRRSRQQAREGKVHWDPEGEDSSK